MQINPLVKEKAIKLRKQGFSYLEISQKLPVHKSTLSGWVSHIELTQGQKQRLHKKMGAAQHLASAAVKQKRIDRSEAIIKQAILEVPVISKSELMLIGAALYWAEGYKQKEHNPSARVMFTNSDPVMIRLFLKWLKDCLDIPADLLSFEVYIHETYDRTKQSLIDYWASVTGFPVSKFDKIYYKHNVVHSYRKNRGDNYFGILRVSVIKSTDLNRKITGWIKGICKHCGVV